MDQDQPGHIKSVFLVIIGWLVGWLVGNTVFSEMALRIFLIFCMKLGDYKGRKVTKPNFWKKSSWFGDICKKISKLAQNQTLFGFWHEVNTKYDLQFEWNLFFRKIFNLEIFDLKIVKKVAKLRFLAIFLTLHH